MGRSHGRWLGVGDVAMGRSHGRWRHGLAMSLGEGEGDGNGNPIPSPVWGETVGRGHGVGSLGWRPCCEVIHRLWRPRLWVGAVEMPRGDAVMGWRGCGVLLRWEKGLGWERSLGDVAMGARSPKPEKGLVVGRWRLRGRGYGVRGWRGCGVLLRWEKVWAVLLRWEKVWGWEMPLGDAVGRCRLRDRRWPYPRSPLALSEIAAGMM
jgi:hypothetical protein